MDALASVAHKYTVPADFAEDIAAVLLVRGLRWPDIATEQALIDVYTKKYGTTLASMLVKRRLQTLKAFVASNLGKAALASIGKPYTVIGATEVVLRLMSQVRIASLQGGCVPCKHINECDFGKAVRKYDIRSAALAVRELKERKLVRHTDCPEEARFKMAEESMEHSAEDIEDSNTAVEAAGREPDSTRHYGKKPPSHEEIETANVKLDEEIARLTKTVDFGIAPSVLSRSDGYDYVRHFVWNDSFQFEEFFGGGDSISAIGNMTVLPIRLDDIAKGFAQSNALPIFQIARTLTTAMKIRADQEDDRTRDEAQTVTEEKSTRAIRTISEIKQITAGEQAKPDDVRDFRAATGKSDVVQHVHQQPKAQMVYVLTDVSASMNGSYYKLAGMEHGVNRRGLGMAFTAALILRAQAENGSVFMREYEGSPHQLRMCHPTVPGSHDRLLRYLLSGLQVKGGSTSVSAALTVAMSDITEYVRRNMIIPKEILIITDGEDHVRPEDLATFKLWKDREQVRLSLLRFGAGTGMDRFANAICDQQLFLRHQTTTPGDIIELIHSL